MGETAAIDQLIDSEALDALRARARREVDDGLLPSCQWALAKDGEVVAGETVGDAPAGDDGRAHMRGFGHATSPRAFGHGGAGGQIAWADPESGISFAWLTNGLDRHHIRQWRRTSGIASRAGATGSATP